MSAVERWPPSHPSVTDVSTCLGRRRMSPREDAVTGQMVTVAGQALRIWRRPGEPGQPPLVLCNGIGSSLDLLMPFVEALDPAIGVIAFDVPGVGGSPLPRAPYRFGGLARLVGNLAQQLGHSRVDVLGTSWGGGLAQQIALQNPRRCRRVVLVSTGTGTLMIPVRPRVLRIMAPPRRHRDLAYLRAVAGDIYGGRIRAQPQLVDDVLAHPTGPVSVRGYRYQLIAGVSWTSLPLLPLLRQPTLVLAGDDDQIHLALVTSADELAPVITQFLREAPAR